MLLNEQHINLNMCTGNVTTENGFSWQNFVIMQYWNKSAQN